MIHILQLAAVVVGVSSLRSPYYREEVYGHVPEEAPVAPLAPVGRKAAGGDGGGASFFPRKDAPNGFQFSSFRGPVSGQIKEIEVPYVQPPHPLGVHGRQEPSNHASTSLDYVAKPDYAFTFGVQDPESGNAQARQESRDGDTVQGEYKVMEPDGTLRTVTYVADPVHGFQARVKYGPSGLPPPPPPTPTPTSGYTGVAHQPQERRQQQPKTSQHRFQGKRRPVTYDTHEQYDEY